MSTRRQEFLAGKSLSQVADTMAGSEPNSRHAHMARAEFLLRQTEYAERAAKAAEDTAKQTAQYTRYMLWSVLLLGLSVLISLVLDIIRLILGT